MRKFKKNFIVPLIILLIFSLIGVNTVLAATTPSLGEAANYAVLGSTYTNTTAGTIINGNLGYTTGPAVAPTVNGTTHIADTAYNQAGTDRAAALSVLNAQPCDFNFPSTTDLSLVSQPLTPGVYCIAAAASIGTGGITLNGNGTYIFRIDGALTTVANSSVTLSNGASACDVFWTPTQATTLGANSSFAGTNIDTSGITIGSNVTWTGRALAFGGTVTTDADTISVPSCTVVPPAPIVPPAPAAPVAPFVPVTPATPAAPTAPTALPPILPSSGIGPNDNTIAWNIIITSGFFIALFSLYIMRKKQII